jgi:hypothetical protein
MGEANAPAIISQSHALGTLHTLNYANFNYPKTPIAAALNAPFLFAPFATHPTPPANSSPGYSHLVANYSRHSLFAFRELPKPHVFTLANSFSANRGSLLTVIPYTPLGCSECFGWRLVMDCEQRVANIRFVFSDRGQGVHLRGIGGGRNAATLRPYAQTKNARAIIALAFIF